MNRIARRAALRRGGPLPMHPAWVPVALDPGAQARANPRGGRQAQQWAFRKDTVFRVLLPRR